MQTNQIIIRDFNHFTLSDTVKGVFLDFDNTLYIYEPCHKAALQAARDTLESEVGIIKNFEVQYEEAKKVVKNRIPTHAASHSRILYFKTMLEKLHVTQLLEKSVEMEAVYWEVFISKMKPLPGLVKFLEVNKKDAKKIVIVSDLTTTLQFRKIIALGIDNFVDFVVTSEEAGAEKPSPEIFNLALEKVGLKTPEVVMVGDSLERDIQGAEGLGIQSIRVVHENVS